MYESFSKLFAKCKDLNSLSDTFVETFPPNFVILLLQILELTHTTAESPLTIKTIDECLAKAPRDEEGTVNDLFKACKKMAQVLADQEHGTLSPKRLRTLLTLCYTAPNASNEQILAAEQSKTPVLNLTDEEPAITSQSIHSFYQSDTQSYFEEQKQHAAVTASEEPNNNQLSAFLNLLEANFGKVTQQLKSNSTHIKDSIKIIGAAFNKAGPELIGSLSTMIHKLDGGVLNVEVQKLVSAPDQGTDIFHDCEDLDENDADKNKTEITIIRELQRSKKDLTEHLNQVVHHLECAQTRENDLDGLLLYKICESIDTSWSAPIQAVATNPDIPRDSQIKFAILSAVFLNLGPRPSSKGLNIKTQLKIIDFYGQQLTDLSKDQIYQHHRVLDFMLYSFFASIFVLDNKVTFNQPCPPFTIQHTHLDANSFILAACMHIAYWERKQTALPKHIIHTITKPAEKEEKNPHNAKDSILKTIFFIAELMENINTAKEADPDYALVLAWAQSLGENLDVDFLKPFNIRDADLGFEERTILALLPRTSLLDIIEGDQNQLSQFKLCIEGYKTLLKRIEHITQAPLEKAALLLVAAHNAEFLNKLMEPSSEQGFKLPWVKLLLSTIPHTTNNSFWDQQELPAVLTAAFSSLDTNTPNAEYDAFKRIVYSVAQSVLNIQRPYEDFAKLESQYPDITHKDQLNLLLCSVISDDFISHMQTEGAKGDIPLLKLLCNFIFPEKAKDVWKAANPTEALDSMATAFDPTLTHKLFTAISSDTITDEERQKLVNSVQLTGNTSFESIMLFMTAALIPSFKNVLTNHPTSLKAPWAKVLLTSFTETNSDKIWNAQSAQDALHEAFPTSAENIYSKDISAITGLVWSKASKAFNIKVPFTKVQPLLEKHGKESLLTQLILLMRYLKNPALIDSNAPIKEPLVDSVVELVGIENNKKPFGEQLMALPGAKQVVERTAEVMGTNAEQFVQDPVKETVKAAAPGLIKPNHISNTLAQHQPLINLQNSIIKLLTNHVMLSCVANTSTCMLAFYTAITLMGITITMSHAAIGFTALLFMNIITQFIGTKLMIRSFKQNISAQPISAQQLFTECLDLPNAPLYNQYQANVVNQTNSKC